jgi:hypothetical protein
LLALKYVFEPESVPCEAVGSTATVTVADPTAALEMRVNAVPWLLSTFLTAASEPLIVTVFAVTLADVAPESPTATVSVPAVVVTVAVTLAQPTLDASVTSKALPIAVAVPALALTAAPPETSGYLGVAAVERVTSTLAGDPTTAVWALPATSATEKVPARVSVLVSRSPTVALDVTAIVQTADDVCVIDVIDEILVSVKSVPAVVDNVVQSIASLPVSVNVSEEVVAVADDAARVTVGADVSMTIAFDPAMLLVPDGTVVDVIALPAESATVPIVKLDTVRSDDVCDAPTVYVPVSDVPADAAVNSTVAPVSSVTVSVLPDWIASLVVAVMSIVAPCLYVPSAVDDENDETVGAVVSMTIAFAPAMLLAPDGTVVDVIALPTVSATVPIVKLETVRSAEFCADVTV